MIDNAERPSIAHQLYGIPRMRREAAAIEVEIKRRLEAGAKLEDLKLCVDQWDRWRWWIEVRTPQDKWLDWQSNNHGWE